MKKFEGLLFCTDLDGTLFASDGSVSRENLNAIEYFKSEGGLFTFITGRPPVTTEAIFRKVQPNAPYGCANGGAIWEPWKGEFLWVNYLSREALELVRAVDENLPEIAIQPNAESRLYFSKHDRLMEVFRIISRVPPVSCHYDEIDEPLLKVVLMHPDGEQIRALETLLRSHPRADEFDFIRSEHSLFEILPKGVSKGGALRKMSELFGIDRSKTLAIGDYNNDVSMLREAGVGIAVANACADAKAAADLVTVSNNEHAIATVIGMLDRGELVL